MLCLGLKGRIIREKANGLVSGTYHIIRLGVWSGAKHCGIDCIKRANSDGDGEADFT